MVVRPHLYWFRMLLAWRGSVLSQPLSCLLLIFFVSLVVIVVHAYLLPVSVNLNTTLFSLAGIALTVFLGFRNDASYDRYWKTRKLWGQLLNAARSPARQALTLPRRNGTNGPNSPNNGVTDADVREFIQVLDALSHALCYQLRHTDAREDLATRPPVALLERVMVVRYRPIVIVQRMGEWVQRCAQVGAFDGYAALAFDRNLNGLSNSTGGCERITDTSLSFAYPIMIHRTVYFFCATLPFGLVESIDSFAPAFAAFVACTFMMHEAIALQLEDPFDMGGDDPAPSALSNTIEDVVLDTLGEPNPLLRAGVWREVISD